MCPAAFSARTPSSEEVLRALADPTRQKLLQLLLSEELNVGELVEVLRIPQSTVSRHLSVLRAASMVQDRRNGTAVLYRASERTADGRNLRSLLLDWVGQQRMGKAVRARMDQALRRRADHTASFFERLGNRWNELRGEAFGEAFAMEAFLSLLPRTWTVADIGTGTGFLLPSLAEHFRRVIAVDPAAAMLECARQRVAGHERRNVRFHHGDLGSLPMRSQSCDLAIACLVLHHVPEPESALAEMHRILRPGGRILLVEQVDHENQAFHEMMQDRWYGFDPAKLARQVSATGFRGVRHKFLRMTKGASGSLECPGLFALCGERPANGQEGR